MPPVTTGSSTRAGFGNTQSYTRKTDSSRTKAAHFSDEQLLNMPTPVNVDKLLWGLLAANERRGFLQGQQLDDQSEAGAAEHSDTGESAEDDGASTTVTKPPDQPASARNTVPENKHKNRQESYAIALDKEPDTENQSVHDHSPRHPTYTISKGDSLSGIGKRFGLDSAQIIELNRNIISDPNKIYPGVTIKLPLAEGFSKPEMQTEVRIGDTLSGIAKRHNINTDTLLDYNKGQIKDRNKIYPGMVLNIPSQSKPQQEAQSTIDNSDVTLKPFFGPPVPSPYEERLAEYKFLFEKFRNDPNAPGALENKNNAYDSLINENDGKHQYRLRMVDTELTSIAERIEEIQVGMANSVDRLRQLPTADMNKGPVMPTNTSASVTYFALLLNADSGGIEKANSAKSGTSSKVGKYINAATGNFLDKVVPFATKIEVYTDDIYSFDKPENNIGSLVIQVRATAIDELMRVIPVRARAKVEKAILASLPNDDPHAAGVAKKVSEKLVKQVQSLDPKSRKLVSQVIRGANGKQLPKPVLGSKHTRHDVQFDKQHLNNGRIRISLSMRDLFSAASGAVGGTPRAGTETLGGIEKAFNNATIGFGYTLPVGKSKLSLLDGMNGYIQVRKAPQAMYANGTSSDKLPKPETIVVVGFESGDIHNVLVPGRNDSVSKKARNMAKNTPTTILGGIKGLGKSVATNLLKRRIPAGVAVGYNIQVKPNASQVMLNSSGQRIYIGNYNGQAVPLPAAATPYLDAFAAKVPQGHPPVEAPKITLPSVLQSELTNLLGDTLGENITSLYKTVTELDKHQNLLADTIEESADLMKKYGDAVRDSGGDSIDFLTIMPLPLQPPSTHLDLKERNLIMHQYFQENPPE